MRTRTDPAPWLAAGGDRWHRVTLALCLGLAVASAMFFLIVALRTPGLDPPPESAALFVVATTASVISYHLLRTRDATGYPAAMLTGGFVVVSVALIVSGAYGPAGPRTNPVGPLSYVALAAGVVLAAGLGWRRGDSSGEPTVSSPPE